MEILYLVSPSTISLTFSAPSRFNKLFMDLFFEFVVNVISFTLFKLAFS